MLRIKTIRLLVGGANVEQCPGNTFSTLAWVIRDSFSGISCISEATLRHSGPVADATGAGIRAPFPPGNSCSNTRLQSLFTGGARGKHKKPRLSSFIFERRCDTRDRSRKALRAVWCSVVLHIHGGRLYVLDEIEVNRACAVWGWLTRCMEPALHDGMTHARNIHQGDVYELIKWDSSSTGEFSVSFRTSLMSKTNVFPDWARVFSTGLLKYRPIGRSDSGDFLLVL